MKKIIATTAVAAAVAGLVAVANPASADGHLSVVADGLDNPRGIALGPGDRIYVAEAGRGGDTVVPVGLGDGDGPICVGMTGAITEIRDGSQRTLIELPSHSSTESGDCTDTGFGAVGPHDVALTGRGELSIVIGLGGSLEDRDEVAAEEAVAELFGTAHRILPNGRNKPLGDAVAFEAANDNDGAIDSNAYGVAILPDGSRLVADAGGNSLVRFMPNGSSSLVAAFAPQCVPWTLPFPNPIPDASNPCGTSAMFPAQSVPTAVAVGPDGDFYVSELGGFPFAPGTARVWKVDSGRSTPAVCSTFALVPNDGCEVYASGLTSLVDLAFGPDGSLYTVQFADGGVLAAELFGQLAGSVKVIAPGGGSPVASIDGLMVPGGVAVGDGHLYVTNFSIFPGAGEVVMTPIPD